MASAPARWAGSAAALQSWGQPRRRGAEPPKPEGESGRAVSRILSACGPQPAGREPFVLAAGTRDLASTAEERAAPRVSYLALHPMGFAVPPRLLLERWALTPPFHPYLATGEPDARRCIFCGTFRRKVAFPPACIPAELGYAASRPAVFGLSSPRAEARGAVLRPSKPNDFSVSAGRAQRWPCQAGCCPARGEGKDRSLGGGPQFQRLSRKGTRRYAPGQFLKRLNSDLTP